MVEDNQVGMCVWKNNFESKLNKIARGNAVMIVNASDG